MKTLLILSLTLLSTAATVGTAFADTRCSDATGHLKYVHTGYNRGIPPREGDVLETIDVLIDGKVVSESIVYKDAKPVLGPINPDFTEIKILNQETYKKDFSAKLTLSKNPSNPASVRASLPEEAYVICHEEFYPVP